MFEGAVETYDETWVEKMENWEREISARNIIEISVCSYVCVCVCVRVCMASIRLLKLPRSPPLLLRELFSL